MSNYGRNFEFRVSPYGSHRDGRWLLTDTGTSLTALPIGAPIVLDGTTQSTLEGGAAHCKLATTAQAPQPGVSGILVYEHAPSAFAGSDPALTLYSDIDTVSTDGTKLVQLVAGREVKVVLRNTVARTFLNVRDYTGRIMVAGLSIATPTLAVGDYLTPGTGNDTSGYWAETADATKGWLRITSVDTDRDEVEAVMLF